MDRKLISNFIYALSLMLLVGAGVDVILSFRDFIQAGKGIGVYGVLIYYAAAFVSFVLWGVSCILYKNIRLAILYWFVLAALTIFIAMQPTWWAASVRDGIYHLKLEE